MVNHKILGTQPEKILVTPKFCDPLIFIHRFFYRYVIQNYLVGFFCDLECAGDFSGSSSIYNSIVSHQIPDDTEGVMETSLRLLHNLNINRSDSCLAQPPPF